MKLGIAFELNIIVILEPRTNILNNLRNLVGFDDFFLTFSEGLKLKVVTNLRKIHLDHFTLCK